MLELLPPARWVLTAVLAIGSFGGVPTVAHAADAELVGLLALATEPQAAEKLDLSAEQVRRLDDLLGQREAAAMGSAAELGGLEPEQRAERLRQLRVESQRKLAGILTDAQLQSLEQLAAAEPDEHYEPMGGGEGAEVPAPAGGEGPAEDSPAKETAPNTDRESGRDAELFDRPQTTTPRPNQSTAKASGDGKLTFNFRYQPWQDVLDWFAQQSDLSLVLESPPSGTFNYSDSRRYTPAEALDVLNSVLLTKGYTLVRRDRMLVLVNLEDGIPPNLVTDVPLAELDQRGEYELVRVLFRVRNMTPEAASEEVSRMVGPQGSVVVLPRAGMLQVTETAGRIRAIRKVIEAIERPDTSELGGIRPYELKFATAVSILPVLRQMLGMAEDGFSTPEGTLQLAVDNSTGTRLLAYGTPEMMDRLEEVLKLVDVPGAARGPIDQLQLEVYPVTHANPEAALLVLQTLLADEPGTRLATDPETGNLIALATTANHATIRATLAQMSEDARQIEVIPLANVEPQLALLSVTKLFGLSTGEEADPRAPIVDVDLSTDSLLVRGTKAQIEQIRALLGQMGESGESMFSSSEQGNVRMLPLTASESRAALEQLDRIWPTLRSNPIQIVSPATAIRSYRPAEQDTPQSNRSEAPEIENMFRFDTAPAEQQPLDRGARVPGGVRAKLAVYQDVGDNASGAQEPEGNVPAPSNTAGKPGSPILVAPGPNGLLIASDDLEALEAFERLLQASTMQTGTSGREYAVFYLKHAKAATAAAILGDIFGASGGTGDSLMGGIADAALGDIGGGLMGDLLGLGGTGPSTGFSAAGVDIVTDARLNALIVYARPDDIDMVFRLLQILDQRIGPMDVEAGGVARLIPVVNTSAEQVAAVVKEIYADRLEGGGGRQPSPEDLMRMLRNSGRGGGEADSQEPEKMTVGVDARSNSLVVRAPDALFYEVQALVEKLDTQQSGSEQATQIVSLKYSNTEAIKEALGPIIGEQNVTTQPQAAAGQGPQAENDRRNDDGARQQQEMMRRIQEFRERMQQSGGRGDRGGGGRGGRGGNRGGR